MLKAFDTSLVRPTASPSKMECTERAIISTKGVMLGQQEPAFLSSSTSFTGFNL
jgi:hypothetical protein